MPGTCAAAPPPPARDSRRRSRPERARSLTVGSVRVTTSRGPQFPPREQGSVEPLRRGGGALCPRARDASLLPRWPRVTAGPGLGPGPCPIGPGSGVPDSSCHLGSLARRSSLGSRPDARPPSEGELCPGGARWKPGPAEDGRPASAAADRKPRRHRGGDGIPGGEPSAGGERLELPRPGRTRTFAKCLYSAVSWKL